MPDINTLIENSSKKKFKKSSYRPWNYMDEIQKEEEEKQLKKPLHDSEQKPNDVGRSQIEVNIIDNIDSTLENPNENNLAKVIVTENTQINKIQVNGQEKIKQEEQESISRLYSIFRLSGHQKAIFTFILERCLSRGLLSSGMITSEILISITNTSLNMVNTSIQRLVDKKLIFRENGKRGRGGFYCFGLSQEVKDAAIEYRRLVIHDNSESPRLGEIQTDNYEMSKIDSRKVIVHGLPKEWEDIDIEPLNHIGFSRGHLVQLYKQGDLDIQSIQDSIYHFAYDLTYNKKAANITKSSPIGYFMGILKRSAIYSAPENYETPKDRALRELLERKKFEKEKREIMIKELISIAFEEWQAKLTEDEKDQFIPEEIRRMRLTGAKIASLKSYFTENIWPQLAPKELMTI